MALWQPADGVTEEASAGMTVGIGQPDATERKRESEEAVTVAGIDL